MIYRKTHHGETGLLTECVSYIPEGPSTYCASLSPDIKESDSKLVRQALSEAGWYEKNDLLCMGVTDADGLIKNLALAEEVGIYLFTAHVRNADFAKVVGVVPDAEGAVNVTELLAALEKSAKHAEDLYVSIYEAAEIPDVLDGLGFSKNELLV